MTRPLSVLMMIAAAIGGTLAPDGSEIQIDLPAALQMHNAAGTDGSGLCVFTSVGHSAIWQDVAPLKDLRDWMKSFPGGGTPDKLDKMIARKCADAKVPVPGYVQVEGDDLAFLAEACASGRMPAVTYSYSPTGRYNGQRIAHMVNLASATSSGWAILDNNYPCSAEKPANYEWLTPEEFAATHKGGGSWAVVLLEPPPPPVPRN